MAVDFVFVWCGLDDLFNNKRNSTKLALNFRGYEMKNGLAGHSIVFVIYVVAGKE